MHIADETDTSAKTCYILLEEDASPLISDRSCSLYEN